MCARAEPALCQAIMLSDNVIVEQGTRKTSLVNCFTHFNAHTIPFTPPSFFVTVFFTNLNDDLREMDLVARIETDSAHVLASRDTRVKLEKDSPPLDRDSILNVTFPFGVTFPVAGRFHVCVVLNKEELGRRPFMVMEAADAASAG